MRYGMPYTQGTMATIIGEPRRDCFALVKSMSGAFKCNCLGGEVQSCDRCGFYKSRAQDIADRAAAKARCALKADQRASGKYE